MGAHSQENRIQTGSVVQLFDCSQTPTAGGGGEAEIRLYFMYMYNIDAYHFTCALVKCNFTFVVLSQISKSVSVCMDLLAHVYNSPFIHHAR